MTPKNKSKAIEKKVLISEDLSGKKSTFQNTLKKDMKKYGKEIKEILNKKGSKAKICEVDSGGGAQGFFSIARTMVMSFFLEKYGIKNIKNMAGNSAGGAQITLMAYYQAIEGLSYKDACYKTIGKMMNMGKLKISKWNFILSLFKMRSVKQITPQNPMEHLAFSVKALATTTYGDLAKKGFYAFTVFSDLVTSVASFAGFKLSLREGMQCTTRFAPPGEVKELNSSQAPNVHHLVDGGISTNLPTYSALLAFNNKRTRHNPKSEKLDFMIVSFLGNVVHYNYDKVKNIPNFCSRLLDYVSIKATAKGIKRTVLQNQEYKYGDREYVPLIPFGAFQDCGGEGVMTFNKKIFRERFKKGVDLAIKTLEDVGLVNKKEAKLLHDDIYNNVDNSKELADMKINETK
jgi:hypothetical protein